ncbi:uncharacterized protein THITE_2169475 [Thermothielavioides terrestris NRRL 8126]|uniref:Uncharacterized protein n=1 Tax=Thermothielavioides terrestris (strain ATCC 38088 / NRRL 8126) TaxID=578455 RepID=G2QSL0_THETT|nr:uncharacterized protein THITE_2169475 [Thermothielavioides terrestris NRRL 8126]AEO63492.1 hypothetical protein THITE_2169475 [Thermothielavioides terrestris NRRL 8126]
MLSRAARPALQTTLPVLRARSARNFSVLRSLRSLGRAMEPHPFERLPVASRPAPADWGRLARRAGNQAVLFFPLGVVLLGWPYVGKVLLDGRI